jgi:hypothetical protein
MVAKVGQLCLKMHRPSPVATQSKAWVYDRSLAGIAVSNPAGGMDMCLFVSAACCQEEVSA